MAAFSFSSPLTWEGSHTSLAPSRGAACMECPAEVHCQFSEPFAGGHGPSHTGHTSLGASAARYCVRQEGPFSICLPGCCSMMDPRIRPSLTSCLWLGGECGTQHQMVVEKNFLASCQEVYRYSAYHLFIGRVTESMQQVFIE